MAATYNTVLTAKDKTAAAFKSVGNSAAAATVKIAKIGAAFATAGVAAGIALTKMSMQNVDALAKVSDRLGIASRRQPSASVDQPAFSQARPRSIPVQ